jgi:hypothetical protein
VVKRVTKIEMIFFIAVEGGSGAVRGEWHIVVVLIQCFDLDSRRNAM